MMIRLFKILSTAGLASFVLSAKAAEATTSPTASMFKMLAGLAIVLLVLALITWAMKKFMPGVTGQQSAIRVVGGVSVGSRERVVVLEVAGRWIVVGVAAGQVSGLANLEAGSSELDSLQNVPFNSNNTALTTGGLNANSFAKWLKESTSKMTEKKDV
jgi:flagellar protein FliO/FliZ